jgi:hypothetical protein
VLTLWGNRKDSRRSYIAVAVVAVAIALVGAACAPPAPAIEIEAGNPGATGPCSMTRTDLAPPFSSPYPISVFEPVGTGSSWTGGSCADGKRPTALVAHGYLGVDPPVQFGMVNEGVQHAVARTPRADTSKFGVIGHSFGGGMTPRLLQMAGARGWGATSTWTVMFAPHFAAFVGDGMIDLPDDIKSLVVSYDNDVFVDAQIAMEIYGSLDIPAVDKHHLMVLSDASYVPALMADHLGPIAFSDSFLAPLPLGSLRAGHFDVWAAWRPVDATARCAMSGKWCEVDLADMGSFVGGRLVRRALMDDEVTDRGPVALQECGFFISERTC